MDSQELSSDIVFEILTRTPSLKTLDTCKSVCKEWQQLIYESSFLPTYCKRTNNVFGYFIQDIIRNKYLSTFASLVDHNDKNNVWTKKLSSCGAIRILASCNQGILCCVRQIDHRNCRYYVCKPTTGQCRALPNPKTRYLTEATAVMVLQSSPCLRYKIISLSNQEIDKCMNAHYRCEIFDSKLCTWREVEDVTLPYEEIIIRRNPPITAGSCVHWLTSHDNVLAFDNRTNSFHKFPLPELQARECKQLVEYKGKLGFTCLTQQGDMELWIMEDNKWIKKMAVNLEVIENVVKFPSPAGFCNADIALLKAYNEVVFYNVQHGNYYRVKLDGLVNAADCFQLRSDLEPMLIR